MSKSRLLFWTKNHPNQSFFLKKTLNSESFSSYFLEVRKKDVTFAPKFNQKQTTMAEKRFKVTIEMPDKKKVVFTKRFLDEYKIEEMVGKNPTRDVVDNYLLYIP